MSTKLSFIEDHEVEIAEKLIQDQLGMDPMRPTGYYLTVKLYVRPEDVHQIKDDKGKPILGSDGKPMYIALPETVTANDKFRSCTALVIAQGPEAYKTGRFKPQTGFMTFTDLDLSMKAAEMLSKSKFCPKTYRGKPEDILIAIQIGLEAGLSPIHSLLRVEERDGNPYIKTIEECKTDSFSDNIIQLFEKNRVKPWCKIGDWVVIPRNEGTQINYRGIPMQIIPDDRPLAIIPDPTYVTRD
jgi:hypothetical protein